MSRLLRTLLVGCVVWAGFVYATGRAVDVEHVRAGMLSEREEGAPVQADTSAPATWPARRNRTLSRSESIPVRYEGKTAAYWARWGRQQQKNSEARGRTIQRLKRELAAREVGPTLAIRIVFGPYADQALRVSWCESRWDTGARNGQYLGLFQMGNYARGRYGHSSSALGQAQAAYRYFVESGRDWSPWECKP